jgi:hypothetical protein
MESLFTVHVKTGEVVKRMTGRSNDVLMSGDIMRDSCMPPFSVRILPPYRNEETKAFRSEVAKELWRIRHP